MSIKVEGAEEAVTRLGNMGSKIGSVVGEALKQIGEECMSSAKSSAPVRTGFLRDSIAITESSEQKVVVESQAGYSGYVNFGTGRQRAQPFFSQAVDQATIQTQTIIKNALSGLVR